MIKISIMIKTTEELNREALQRNNDELDRLCKKLCLIVGWCLVIIMIISMVLRIIIHEIKDD